MTKIPESILKQSLTESQILEAQKSEGKNILFIAESKSIFSVLKDIFTEPMLLILIFASVLYFSLNETQEGILLLFAISLVFSISLYQNNKSENALASLKKLTDPQTSVIRNRKLKTILVEEIVVGEVIMIEEGQSVPADGEILDCHDLSINDSALTGESVSVDKEIGNAVLAGSLVVSGSGFLKVTAIGKSTELGKLGKSIQGIEVEKSRLQIQINDFVKKMAYAGFFAFLLVWGLNFLKSGDVWAALLFGLSMAMALIPEEIPVAFSSFMALGAYRLAGKGILVKNPMTVESLGATSVVCFDKTGTLTVEEMRLTTLYHAENQSLVRLNQSELLASPLLQIGFLASEPIPFDAMEKAIHEAYHKAKGNFTHKTGKIAKEYPLSGKPPMMTHVYELEGGKFLVTAKGAVEKILSVCTLSENEKKQIQNQALALSREGLRVLAVSQSMVDTSDFPMNQEDFTWTFLGLLGLENPPKQNAGKVVKEFQNAGIEVKMITGDYPETAISIAKQLNFTNLGHWLTGADIQKLGEEELQSQVKNTSVFARMFPEAKLRVIEALKKGGAIITMTGDGVNDGPALKAANVGVSMGKKGTEIASQAASLVLVHDDLEAMTLAVKHGRQVYINLKKAISYILSIHIPIILMVAIPLIFNWKWANLFSPIHIIFLELVMGPTCSIAFENEPAEKNLMLQKPRKMTDSFFNFRELWMGIIQGIIIATAVLGVYYFAMDAGAGEKEVRTLAFITIVQANIFLTLSNRSFTQTIFQTIAIKNHLLWIMLGATFCILLATLLVPDVQGLFSFQSIGLKDFAFCSLAALLGTWWLEVYKFFRTRKT